MATGKLSGRVAIVTGSSRGIGRAIATTFAGEGAAVVVNHLQSPAEAAEVIAEIERSGGRAKEIQADVSREAEVNRLVAETLAAFGSVDILVNNAGLQIRAPLAELGEELWDKIMAVNLRAPFLCARAVMPPMREQGSGAIVNLASIRGLIGQGSLHYSVAKAGVITMTKCLAQELAPQVRVNAIAPGYTETRLHTNMTPEAREKVVQSTPLRRFGEPQDVANAALFLASDDAAFITGQTVVVDGGIVMH
ncbi:MAG: 3-oxoacyl-ACP reductase FabG [Chloroflexi bacterium]|nr:3-oxoacyl-ACP reductase FabG [Chloroflexota bacterium]